MAFIKGLSRTHNSQVIQGRLAVRAVLYLNENQNELSVMDKTSRIMPLEASRFLPNVWRKI